MDASYGNSNRTMDIGIRPMWRSFGSDRHCKWNDKWAVSWLWEGQRMVNDLLVRLAVCVAVFLLSVQWLRRHHYSYHLKYRTMCSVMSLIPSVHRPNRLLHRFHGDDVLVILTSILYHRWCYSIVKRISTNDFQSSVYRQPTLLVYSMPMLVEWVLLSCRRPNWAHIRRQEVRTVHVYRKPAILHCDSPSFAFVAVVIALNFIKTEGEISWFAQNTFYIQTTYRRRRCQCCYDYHIHHAILQWATYKNDHFCWCYVWVDLWKVWQSSVLSL